MTSKLDTPVATLPSTWHYRVSTGTGWPVSVYCDWMAPDVIGSVLGLVGRCQYTVTG